MVRRGADCAGRGERERRRLAGSASRQRTQSLQLAVVGVDHARRAIGDLILRARATDLAGRTQPERAEWNRLGYGNNAIQEVPVRVMDAPDR